MDNNQIILKEKKECPFCSVIKKIIDFRNSDKAVLAQIDFDCGISLFKKETGNEPLYTTSNKCNKITINLVDVLLVISAISALCALAQGIVKLFCKIKYTKRF